MLLPYVLILLLLSTATSAAVTVYGQIPFGQTHTASGVAPAATLAAYDETILKPPQLPTNPAPAAFTLNLPENNASVSQLSIMQRGTFYGFSIEMSVITQLLGKNSTHINVPFLNLVANIQKRAGGINIRLGGNTQDFAVYVDSLDDGLILKKDKVDTQNPTLTPTLRYTIDLFYLAANISSLVNARWYLGIPFNDTNWRLQVAEFGQEILGDYLLGLQAGNEPDLYEDHKHRNPGYSPQNYFDEFSQLIKTIDDNSNISKKNMLIGPSLATGSWTPKMVWDTGYITSFSDSLYALSVEHYPSNNCFVRFNIGSYTDPQETFPTFLTHDEVKKFVEPYLDSSSRALAAGKPFIMFETNTATCGGLPGISDSFGAALWAIDYGFTMAVSNFSQALLHFGGQNVYYNPFTAPPTNQTSFNQWTAGAIYYSVLAVAEAFGTSNTSQIADTSNNGPFNPSYSIYENGELAKVALINFNDDSSGGSDITVNITVNGGAVPTRIHVNRIFCVGQDQYIMGRPGSTQLYSDPIPLFDALWKTLGNKFEVDGILRGNLDIVPIACDQTANVCRVPVKAPGFALVFLKDPPDIEEQTPLTFATTAFTKTVNTATVDPSFLATSNGHSGKDRTKLGSTSPGSTNSATLHASLSGACVLFGLIAGGFWVLV